MTQFLAFTLRVATGTGVGSLDFAPPIVDLSLCLITKLETRDSASIEEAIHQLVMMILDRVNVTDGYVCPVSRFIIYANVLPSGQIRDPGRINGTLTELKWPSRASTFWEAVRQIKAGNGNGDPNL
jgi:hypothetical protein